MLKELIGSWANSAATTYPGGRRFQRLRTGRWGRLRHKWPRRSCREEEKFCILYTNFYMQSTNIRLSGLSLSQLPHLAIGLFRPMGYPWAGQAFLAGPWMPRPVDHWDTMRDLLGKSILPFFGLDNQRTTYPFVDLWGLPHGSSSRIDELCRLLPAQCFT
jgi:hypothetical protein